ncbi:hypothetical protein FAI40_03405 [Acetobacteraceae bacterium]|nr:hypothetical protein FAI40_03405 [Acetobacteraceae bacterium]
MPQTASEMEKVLCHAPPVRLTQECVFSGKIAVPLSRIESVNVRRRTALNFGWGAFWAFCFFLYGFIENGSAISQMENPWNFSFILLSHPLAWTFMIVGLIAFFPALWFTIFPPFGLYLEVAEAGIEKEILIKTALKSEELEKIEASIEQAMAWAEAPIKTV